MIRFFIIIFFCFVTSTISSQDRLVAATGTASGSNSGREGTFRRLTRARLDVTGVDKVLVLASFDTRYNRRSTQRDGIYRLSEGTQVSGSLLLSLRSNGGADKGIGSLIHVFDVSGLSGNTNFLLEHASNIRQPVVSAGTVVAIALTTSESGVEISHDLKSNTNAVPTSGNLGEWSVVSGLITDNIQLVEQGDVFVSASINSQADGDGTGEWKLQYRSNESGWMDLGYSTFRTITSAAEYGISTLSNVIQNLPAGNCSFRLMHRQTEGTPGDLTTYSAQLAACALVYEVSAGLTRTFPSFSAQQSSATTSGSTMSAVLSQSVDPANETDLFMQAQYVATSDASLDAAGYDLAIDQNILDGTDQLRYLSTDEIGNGGSVGLGSSLQAGTSYGVSLRHQSASGVNLNTLNATLSGFQLTSVGNSVWKGGGLIPTAWDQTDNWIGEVPGPRENAIIPAGATSYPILQTPTECQDLSVRTGGSLTLDPTSSLTINGFSEIDGFMEVQSDGSGSGSLIVLGPSTGNITYNSHLAANRWYIVSPPVSGQSILSFLQNGDNQIPYSDSFEAYGLTDYSEQNNKWNSFFTSSVQGNFSPGEGYLMRRESPGGAVSYTGGLMDSDFQCGITTLGSRWNAVGNPFLSSIGVTSDASTTENFLTVNLAQLDPNYSVLYLWDEQDGYSGTQNNYKVIGNAGYIDNHGYEELQMDYLQAGQGFLVKAVEGGGTLHFNKAMQSHQNSIGMLKSTGTSWDGFKLVVASGDRSESAIVCFHEGMSPGLDPSYDAGLLNSKPDLSVYTRLLEEDSGIGFKIQCLPHQDNSDLVIPVGVDLLSGGELAFSTAGVYLPSTHQIWMEDRLTATMTDLTEHGSSYGVLLGENTRDTGRFFLHIKDPNATAIVYKDPPKAAFSGYCHHNTITIHGMVEEGATAYLLDMTGRYLGSYSLQKGKRHEIPIPSLKEGLYLVAVVDGHSRNVLKILKK